MAVQRGAPCGPWAVGLRLGPCAHPWRVAAQFPGLALRDKFSDLQVFLMMARPGLEPGTPRFSGSGGRAISQKVPAYSPFSERRSEHGPLVFSRLRPLFGLRDDSKSQMSRRSATSCAVSAASLPTRGGVSVSRWLGGATPSPGPADLTAPDGRVLTGRASQLRGRAADWAGGRDQRAAVGRAPREPGRPRAVRRGSGRGEDAVRRAAPSARVSRRPWRDRRRGSRAAQSGAPLTRSRPSPAGTAHRPRPAGEEGRARAGL
jgi:hypothetical protein